MATLYHKPCDIYRHCLLPDVEGKTTGIERQSWTARQTCVQGRRSRNNDGIILPVPIDATNELYSPNGWAYNPRTKELILVPNGEGWLLLQERIMKPKAIGPFLGMNNRLPAQSLSVQDKGYYMADAVNIDFTNDGWFRRRKGAHAVQAMTGRTRCSRI